MLFKQKVVDQDLKNSKVSETLKAILSLKEEEKQFLTKLAQSKPTGARGLAQLLTAISKENDREAAFLSSLNQSGIKGLKAQAMCFCAKVCTKKVTNSSEFNLICSL